MTKQQLGGTRHSSPLGDEVSYPLTNDEYFLIKENLNTDKISNFEAMLLSLGISSLISFIIFCMTGSFENKSVIEGKEVIEPNYQLIIIVIIYGAVTFGSVLGFIFLLLNKKKSKNIIARLDSKITNHLNEVSDE
ncbi:hypothetical protein [Olleya sp. YS]|uniref:hypothetical protein n=1 Tax=Olleya sp. YS TaxID=3028318 RepID=UPI00243421D3|nr:hypothetical protein [Olleya sp. YS]WGD35061.1 hypothetical protein Ollyesu_01275 [Olleya sp. YS]